MNCNNVAGILNSHLLHYYARVDERFPALSLAIKHWAIRAHINDAMTGTLNSYSLILLTVHYLHCGCTPPVLPNLQSLMPEKFSGRLLHEAHLGYTVSSNARFGNNRQSLPYPVGSAGLYWVS